MASVKALSRVLESKNYHNSCDLLNDFFFFEFLKSIDMSSEMAAESMEVITMSVDKHQATKNYEVSLF